MARPVSGAEIVRNVGTQHHIEIVKQSGVHHVRAARKQFLGHTGVDAEGTGNTVLLHQALHCDGRCDIHGLPRIMTFAVARSTGNQRRVIGHARLLRSFREAIDVRHETDDRFARAPARHEGRGHPRDTSRYGESFLFQNAGDISRSFELLKPEFGEAENGIHHLLGERGIGANNFAGLVLESVEGRGGG